MIASLIDRKTLHCYKAFPSVHITMAVARAGVALSRVRSASISARISAYVTASVSAFPLRSICPVCVRPGAPIACRPTSAALVRRPDRDTNRETAAPQRSPPCLWRVLIAHGFLPYPAPSAALSGQETLGAGKRSVRAAKMTQPCDRCVPRQSAPQRDDSRLPSPAPQLSAVRRTAGRQAPQDLQ